MTAKNEHWRTAWVVGASTGIGMELALLLQSRASHVAVSARSVEKLEQLASGRESIRSYPLDVTDQEAIKSCAESIEAECGPIDLAVLSAGTWEMMPADKLNLDAIRKGVEVNYLGVINALAAVLPTMLSRGSGHIAIIASVAGYRGLPNSIAYGPTKAALINLAETLRSELEGKGITVSIVNPGFVETPMTQDNPFPMPGIMKADEAASRLLDGLLRKDYEIVFPKRLVYVLKLFRILPNWLFFWIVRTFVMKS